MTLEIIFGLTRLIIGIVILAYIYGIFTAPNSKSNIVKRPNLSKVLAMFLVASGGYSIVNSLLSTKNNFEWSKDEQIKMVDGCVKASLIGAPTHPDWVKDYCECCYQSISSKLSAEDFSRLVKANKDKGNEWQFKYFMDCLNTLKSKIEAEQKAANNNSM
jgi:hypothetical protein